MEDRTMPPRIIPLIDSVGEKVTPYCSACDTPVPDLSVNHHVCVPDKAGDVVTPGGKFRKTTRDEAAAIWQKDEDGRLVARAANPEAEKVVEPPSV